MVATQVAVVHDMILESADSDLAFEQAAPLHLVDFRKFGHALQNVALPKLSCHPFGQFWAMRDGSGGTPGSPGNQGSASCRFPAAPKGSTPARASI